MQQKPSELIIYVTVQDLKDAIEELENGSKQYLKLHDNLFNIASIKTCLNVKDNLSWFNKENISFKFSYADQNFSNLITVKYLFEDTSVYAFLKEAEYLNDEQLQSIYKKVMNVMKQEPRTTLLENSIRKANDMLSTEALCILTTAVNKDDVDGIMNDYNYRLNSFLERKNAQNEEAVGLIKALYEKLLVMKLSETISNQ